MRRKGLLKPKVSSRPVRDLSIAEKLHSRPADRRDVYLLGANGIISAVRNAQGLDEFLGGLAREFACTEALRSSARRTDADKMRAR